MIISSKLCKKRQTFLIILGSVILGLILRIDHLDLRSFWLDEADTANLIKSNFGGLWEKLATNASNALYVYLLKFWSLLFGDSETALRSLSLLFGLLAIIAIYKLGKILFDKKVGYWSAFLLAVSYFSIFYSIQARQYSLVILLSILSYYCFSRLLASFRLSSAILYILTTVAGLYSHPWFFLLLIAQAVYFLISQRKNKLVFLSYQIIIIFLALPGIINLWRYGASGASDWIGLASPRVFVETWHYFTFGAGWIYLLVTLLSVAVITLTFQETETKISLHFNKSNLSVGNKNFLLILSYLFLPLLGAFIISQYIPFYASGRYEAIVLPAFILGIAYLWSKIKWPEAITITIILLIIFSFREVFQERQAIASYQFNDRRVALQLLNLMNDEDWVIFTGLSRPTFDYYLPRLNKADKNIIEVSFPAETANHPAYQNLKKLNIEAGQLSREANNLVTNIKEAAPAKVWLIFDANNPAGQILYQALEKNLKLVNVFDVSNGAPFHYQAILEYKISE